MDDLPLDMVFADHSGGDENFPGFLLANHGKSQLADQRALARTYAQTCLKAIDVGLDDLLTPEAAYPALFLARHTLELYLKGLVPDWDNQRPKQSNRHAIGYLVQILSVELKKDYHDHEVAALSKFLTQISMIDPKSMAFRYPDGAVVSLQGAPIDDPEIWINFHHLKQSLSLTFEALDRIWTKRISTP